MTAIDQQIEELGAWAAGLELSAADPKTPSCMRQKDTELCQGIGEEPEWLKTARAALALAESEQGTGKEW